MNRPHRRGSRRRGPAGAPPPGCLTGSPAAAPPGRSTAPAVTRAATVIPVATRNAGRQPSAVAGISSAPRSSRPPVRLAARVLSTARPQQHPVTAVPGGRARGQAQHLTPVAHELNDTLLRLAEWAAHNREYIAGARAACDAEHRPELLDA
ncbi:hypothetical protein [Streptomyces sp. NPDC046942]|uniref:hypothetical protein n=1 Tax=Streptomyces sp. NPDC046942 TaxID=3155137 RepID=UPI0033E451F5